jgi:N-methylhydantoinase A
VLERQLARTGLITTAGFRDVLELGRRTRPQAYGMHGALHPGHPPRPAAGGARADGCAWAGADSAGRSCAARAIPTAGSGLRGLVIHFLHAYANPAHERRAGPRLPRTLAEPLCHLGHALLSESREYERGVTAAVNASGPAAAGTLCRAAGRRTGRARAISRDLLVMNGNGGMVSAKLVAREAVKTVMSGPASGVMAAVDRARAGVANLMTYDMGGTSTDVAMIRDARAPVSNEIEVEYAMPIHVPMVDVRTVGAGGGSIARIDAGGMLRVGPESAGSTPRSDLLWPGRHAGHDFGRQPDPWPPARQNALDRPPRRPGQAMPTRSRGPLGLSVEQAAEAVIRIANTIWRGRSGWFRSPWGPIRATSRCLPLAGQGRLHATALARELNVPKVLIPARPGITNALGCVVADLRHDFVRTLNRPLDVVDMADVHAIFAAQEAEGRRLIGLEKHRVSDSPR